MSDLGSFSDEQILILMEVALIGVGHGLDVAEHRIRGNFEIEPLSFEVIKSRLRRDGD